VDGHILKSPNRNAKSLAHFLKPFFDRSPKGIRIPIEKNRLGMRFEGQFQVPQASHPDAKSSASQSPRGWHLASEGTRKESAGGSVRSSGDWFSNR
jgi:hypothetical protein